MQRFTLYRSPHSLPTSKVALMLRMSEEPFPFRYVTFQIRSIRRPSSWLSRAGVKFLCWSRANAFLSSPQPSSNTSRRLSTAFRVPIQWHDRLCGNDSNRDVDALFPAIFGCYVAKLDQKKLLPLNIGRPSRRFDIKSRNSNGVAECPPAAWRVPLRRRSDTR